MPVFVGNSEKKQDEENKKPHDPSVQDGGNKGSGGKVHNRANRIEISEAKTDSYLSNERTFLNWMRTALGGFLLGFAIARLGFWLDQFSTANSSNNTPTSNTLALYIGIGIVILSAVMTVLAVFRFRTINQIIQKGGGSYDTSIMNYVTIATLVIAAIIIIYLLLASQSLH